MGLVSTAYSPLAWRAVEQLRTWPALRLWRADCGSGRALAIAERQIVHLPDAHAAEVFLTWPVIERMGPPLWRAENVRVRPDADWIEIALFGETDLELLISLTSVAIKAHLRVARGARPNALCPRVTWSRATSLEAGLATHA
ncbi:luciferase family protein [Actinomadura rayongensis]|uniref:Luciferase domain-containing protein n=1 Tax=Actinomadura rayongensis TaxID=1429076 RepID=A0A6I4WEK0_9ACTN|nr:luciferase family protein [Actinomadura rayongensis]MXQ64952.1 hypothetical protein [Actinomadura rayongensis]